MKASMKFRQEQKPLTRAKIPLSILGFPFESGVIAGDPKELALSLATSFESGPSIKVAYRPNDGFNPFSLVFKTGIGRFGAPNPSPMTMSVEFNLIGSHNPRFFVHFNPQFGDFSIKKSQSSDFVKKRSIGGFGSGSDDDSIEMVESPLKKVPLETANQAAAAAAEMFCELLRGMEGSARTALPVMRRAVVNFRWGFRLPDEGAAARKGAMGKLPLLVMNKIGIEHIVKDKKDTSEVESRAKLSGGEDDVAGTCLAMKRQLEMIQFENGIMRKTLDELRYEFASGKSVFPVGGGERMGRGGGGGGGGGEKKLKEERDVKDDAKKGTQ